MKLTLLLSGGFASLLVSSAALADVLPPDGTPCEAKAAGDSCTTDTGAAGTCLEETCTGGHPLPDGGFEQTQSPCLLCAADFNCGGLPSPDYAACSGKSSDAPCTTNGVNGVCVPVNCGVGAYACDPHGAQGTTDAGGDTGPSQGSDQADAGSIGAPNSPSNGQGTTTSSSSGCSVGASDVGSGLVLLGVLVPFLPFARRRRST